MSPRLDAIEPVVQSLRRIADTVLDHENAIGFEVAASEALANIVLHGHANIQTTTDVSIELTVADEGLYLRIFDQGAPGPTDLFHSGPNLEDIDVMSESGRGLALIRHYTDQINYAPARDGNQLNLTFLKSPGPAPANEVN